tara:strand:+ start:374 stop:754 length:381 start_codon:yes stop_codon:yes gene_type:complete
MESLKVIKIGALSGVLSVLFGAFGAHGLEDLLFANGRIDTFETAVKYQFYHSLALLFIGILMQTYQVKYLTWATNLFIFGIVMFSGSLYVLSLTNFTLLGAITPIGGLFFVFGWLALYKSTNSSAC